MRVAFLALLLIGISSADIVYRRVGIGLDGVGSLSDSTTLTVTAQDGTTQKLRVRDVQGVCFEDKARYEALGARLNSLGVNVALLSKDPDVAEKPKEPEQAPVQIEKRTESRQQKPDQALLMAAYQSDKRDRAMAGLLSVLVPMLGHIYAGETGTGVLFLVAESVEIGVAVLAFRAAQDNELTPGSQTALHALGATCAVAVPITKFWECVDAMSAADRYNRALKERLGLRVGARVDGSGAICGLAWKF